MRNCYVFLLLLSFSGYSQGKPNELKEMVDLALVLSANDLSEINTEDFKRYTNEEVFEKYLDGAKDKAGYIHLINEDQYPYVVDDKLTEVGFMPIDIYYKENRKLLKKGISTWKIICELEKDTFTVGIVSFSVSYKNKQYYFVNGGGYDTIFKYNCQTSRWEVIEHKAYGI